MKPIDKLLNSITMYRFTLYYLIVLVGTTVILSFLNILPYSPLDILLSTLIAVVVSYITNIVFARMFRAVTNTESALITALILVLIIPVKFPHNAPFMVLAAGTAMATKYFVTIEKRHIFNPAAASVAAISLLSAEHTATWWVGTPAMLPVVLVGGLLLMRKIRREELIFSFFTTFFLLAAVGTVIHTGSLAGVLNTWKVSVTSTALLFFTFIMLTEPLTSPATNKLQGFYAAFVAILYTTPQLRLLSIGFTPEQALCLGNIFSYIVSPNYRLFLTLKEKQQLTSDTALFIFNPIKPFKFTSGQYMEWTLPHKNTDNRGNRRYFSLASSPTEQTPMILVKFYSPPSSFKNKLFSLFPGKHIIASHVAGDFTLPKQVNKPLVFIAGGVGIAPFRSMIQYIIDKNLQVDITLIFANRRKEDIVFATLFEKAKAHGVKTVYTLTSKDTVPANWSGEVGYVNAEMIKKLIQDYKKRIFYISGPQLMVQNYEQTLQNMHIPRKQIVSDYFPGY